MPVTEQDKLAMKNILEALDGKSITSSNSTHNVDYTDDISGPGQVSRKAVEAMAQVLTRLNNVTSEVMSESNWDSQLNEAVNTTKITDGVKVGNYKIMIKEDVKRIAGKQYYSIYNSQTGDVIADDLTLYETALAVVKQLNNGRFANHPIVRKLFDADNRYTSHRTDAIVYKIKANRAEKIGNMNKKDLFESRHQASAISAQKAKKDIKSVIAESARTL